jgi:hypothetical protein
MYQYLMGPQRLLLWICGATDGYLERHQDHGCRGCLESLELDYSPEALGRSSSPIAALRALVEQTENALIFFYVAAIFAVVTWNADRSHQ